MSYSQFPTSYKNRYVVACTVSDQTAGRSRNDVPTWPTSRVGPALEAAVDAQMNGGRTSVIEAMCTKELGDPFRKDALSRPIRHLAKYQNYP